MAKWGEDDGMDFIMDHPLAAISDHPDDDLVGVVVGAQLIAAGDEAALVRRYHRQAADLGRGSILAGHQQPGVPLVGLPD